MMMAAFVVQFASGFVFRRIAIIPVAAQSRKIKMISLSIL